MVHQPEQPANNVVVRGEVDAYLRAMSERLIALEWAIAEARDRAHRARSLESRISELERRVGEWLLGALAEAWPASDHIAALVGRLVGDEASAGVEIEGPPERPHE